MPSQGLTLVPVDAAAVLARLAALLVREAEPGRALRGGLQLLVDDVGVRSAVLRDAASGDVVAAAGDVLRAVPARTRSPLPPVVELPVHGVGGTCLASLTVVGARPSTMPLLRTASCVLGLALGGVPVPEDEGGAPPPLVLARAVLDAAERDRDELADALHDGPVQDLVVARFAADAAVRGGDPRLTRDAVQTALVGLRRVLWHLRPRGGDGLPAALAGLSERLVEAGRPGLLLHCAPGSEALTGSAATTAYRLVQAVALALPEGARPLEVALAPAPGTAVLELRGAAPADLERWHRRARALGGSLLPTPDLLRLVLPLAARTDPASPPPDPEALP